MTYQSATFSTAGSTKAYLQGTNYNSTTYQFTSSGPAPAGYSSYIVDQNTNATEIALNDTITFYVTTNTGSTSSYTGTYLGYYLNGTTEDPFIYDNSTYDLLGAPGGLSPYTIVQAAYDQGTVTCFASGTLIRTIRGNVAVEKLAIGDRVVTSSGEHRPIRWLGHRTTDCTRSPGARALWPVRIAAHAFGPSLPSRDLYLSPGHSVCVRMISEVLIPIQELVNGSTVAYAPTDTVTYWHVELDSHDILLAENMPAESYLEMGENRRFFAADSGIDVPADALARTHADFCRRFVDGGPLLAVAREELGRRAEELGWAVSRAVEIVGLVGDRRIKPLVLDGEAIFALPPDAGDVAIRSCLTTPALMGGADPRPLGLAVYGLSLVTEARETHPLDLDAPELRDCFHAGERQEGLHYRWTRGELVIPAALLHGHAEPLMLRLSFEPTTIRGWTAPKTTAMPDAARSVLRIVA